MAVVDKVKTYLKKIEKENHFLNAVLHVNPQALQEAKAIDAKKTKGRLYGYVFGIKSNINVKGLIANCASRVLENYTSTYDATVIEKIKAEDGVIIGMLNMDEFAAGSSGEHSAFGPTKNPVAPEYIPGGSSAGSAAAVAADFCDVSLGSDTGCSIRTPACLCGIVGIKPSYGCVSRYGLMDLSMSLDQIGPLAKNVDDAALVLDVIKGKDNKDTTTFESQPIKLVKPKKATLGILKLNFINPKIQKLIDERTQKVIKQEGWSAKEVSIKHIDLAVQTYYPLVYSEFFSATRRFDGRRYGHKIEEYCGEEVLRRILGGSEITKEEHAGQYYQKALQVKEKIREEIENIFKEVDAIILPVIPSLPWKLSSTLAMKPEEEYAYDALTIPANLAGACALSLPIGNIDKIPMGVQIMCAPFEESKMLSIAKVFESLKE